MSIKKSILRSLITVSALCSLAIILPLEESVTAVGTSQESPTEVASTSIPEIKEAPYASHFFPKELLKWSPETDANASHNRSNVPLAKRVQGSKTNQDQSTEAKVVSLAITNRNTSGTPSQGSSDKAVYNFSYWQYIDTMVAWAGSAGEGIIVPPSGDVIDSAHRNGVPVLGTVFFPPAAYGGKSEWVQQFVEKDENGRFIVADKLLELADYYGFDGWFINQETQTDPATAKAMKELLLYLQEHKKAEMDIMWYDSMLENGSISWQGALNDKNSAYFQTGDTRVSDTMFLDFNWKNTLSKISKSAEAAKDLNRSPYDLFAGIDVQAQGFNSRPKPSAIVENGKPIVSLGLYCPDWTLRDGANYDVTKYWQNEEKFWVNAAGDPRDTTLGANEWQGISRYFVEKSPVTSLPFVTNFNVGNGDNVYQNGELVKEGTFNNRSLQDIMPTYRWIVANEGNQLTPSVDYSTAYNGGSSIALTGSTTVGGTSTVKLYKSELALTGKESGTILYQGEAELELVLGFKDKPEEMVSLVGETTTVGDWKKVEVALDAYQNKTVDTISVKVKGTTENPATKIALGQIAIAENKTSLVSPVKNVTISGQSIEEDLFANLRLNWESAAENTSNYRIYRVDQAGARHYEGTSGNQSYYVSGQKRPADNILRYQIVPVDNQQNEYSEQAGEVEFNFPELQAPLANFSASKSFIKVGEEITLTSHSALSAEKLEWLIEGGTPENAEGETVKTSFSKAGTYTVRLTASNQAGANEAIKENYITVYDETFTEPLVNLSLSAVDTDSSGYTNQNETPMQALDGDLLTKWCDNANDQPWMSVDLGREVSLTSFKLFHAEAGGENAEWNTRDYEILVSHDNKNWTQVVHQDKNTKGITEDSIPLTEARYVKLKLNKAEQTGKVARIYDFEILGYDKTGIEVGKNQAALSELRSLYYQTNVNEADYTADSFANLVAARLAVKDVLDKEAPNLDEIETTKQQLKGAFDSLVTVKDSARLTLENEINAAKKIEGTLYTEASFERFTSEIEKAELLLKQSDTTIDALVVQIKQLQEAKINLVLKTDQLEQTRNELLNLIVEAKKIQPEDYTAESYQELTKSIQTAEELANNEVASLSLLEIAKFQLTKTMNSLVTLEADKLAKARQELEEFLQSIELLNADNYTPESLAILFENIKIAKENLQKNELTVEMIQADKEKISQSLAELVPSESAILEKAIEELRANQKIAKALSEKEYTVATYQKVKEALESAEVILEQPNGRLQDIELINVTLIQAMNNLKTVKEEAKQVALQKLIDYVQALEALNELNYTSDSFAKVTEQIKLAKQVIENPMVTLEELEETLGNLENSVNQLISLEEATLTEAREKLTKLLETAKAIVASDYTTDSYSVLTKAMEEATGLLFLRKPATLAEIEGAHLNLATAIDQLVTQESVDRNALKIQITELLTKAKEAISSGKYNELSSQKLEQVVNQVEGVVADPVATIENLVAAKTNLTNAINELVLKEEVPAEVPATKPEKETLIPKGTNAKEQVVSKGNQGKSEFPQTGEANQINRGAVGIVSLFVSFFILTSKIWKRVV